MKRSRFLVVAFALAAMSFIFGLTGSAQAQVKCATCPACTIYWVRYTYVYPPAPATSPFTVILTCADGRQFTTSENADGHYTYPADPTCVIQSIEVTWNGPPPGTSGPIPVPTIAGGNPVPTPYGTLFVDAQFDSHGCLQ